MQKDSSADVSSIHPLSEIIGLFDEGLMLEMSALEYIMAK